MSSKYQEPITFKGSSGGAVRKHRAIITAQPQLTPSYSLSDLFKIFPSVLCWWALDAMGTTVLEKPNVILRYMGPTFPAISKLSALDFLEPKKKKRVTCHSAAAPLKGSPVWAQEHPWSLRCQVGKLQSLNLTQTSLHLNTLRGFLPYGLPPPVSEVSSVKSGNKIPWFPTLPKNLLSGWRI